VPGAVLTPGANTIDFDGRRYVLEESGSARYTSTGTTGLLPQGTVQYYDYRARDGVRLSFEQYGESGKWEVGRGEDLGRHEIRVYPATMAWCCGNSRWRTPTPPPVNRASPSTTHRTTRAWTP